MYQIKLIDNEKVCLLGTMNKNTRIPKEPIMIPGTIKDQPQAVFTKIPAISEPKMFPTEVWEFQIPMIKPRLKQSHSKTN